MLIGASLLVLSVIVIFSLVFGGGFIGGSTEIAIDNEAIVDGVSSTFLIDPTQVFWGINTGDLYGAITIVTITLIAIAGITGISVLSSGINPQSARIIVTASVMGTLWVLLSLIAFPLILSIEIFGALIYVMISIAYIIGVLQMIGGTGQ